MDLSPQLNTIQCSLGGNGPMLTQHLSKPPSLQTLNLLQHLFLPIIDLKIFVGVGCNNRGEHSFQVLSS